MSDLTFSEKQHFEKIFEMGSGYLLDFSNSSLYEFFNDFQIDIGNQKYDRYGSSKAKRLRAFWEIEDNELVGKVLQSLLDIAVSSRDLLTKDIELAQKNINRLVQNKASIVESTSSTSISEKQIINERIWNNSKLKVFFSHKSEYKAETAKLKEKLNEYGISCFVAHEDITPTLQWQEEIENALHTMDILVALMTEGFKDSDWTDQEIGFAVSKNILVIPVNLGQVPYGFIGKYQGLSTTWKDVDIKILQQLMQHQSMLEIFIDKVVTCPSYDKANKLSKLLPYIKQLSNKNILDLIDAFNSNNQLSDSHGFSGYDEENYGKGLVYYLNKHSNKNFDFDDDYKIKEI